MAVFNTNLLNYQPMELVSRSINHEVFIITRAGSEFRGTLLGIDDSVNCVLSDVTETNPQIPDKTIHYEQTLVNGMGILIIVPYQP